MGVTVEIKSRKVKVVGPRGTLQKSFQHMSQVQISMEGKTISVELWFGLAKQAGVIKGFKYRMKMVYAHFPTNVQIAGDGKSLDVVNFIGQKVKFHVDALEGVKVERDAKSNTELLIHGND